MYKTNYKDLFLTKNKKISNKLIEEVNWKTYTDTRVDYLQYNLENKTSDIERYFQKDICRKRFNINAENEILSIKENIFGKRNGDVLYSFQCKN